MSDERKDLLDIVERVVARHADSGASDGWDAQLWVALEQIGVTALSAAAELGGGGGSILDSAEVLRTLGRYTPRVPLAETDLLAAWLCTSHATPVPAGPLAAAVAPGDLQLTPGAAGWRVTGHLPRVAWGRYAELIAVLCPAERPESGTGHLLLLRPGDYTVAPEVNLAGEPRDTLHLDAAAVPAQRVLPWTPMAATPTQFVRRGALGRAALCVGGLERALELSVQYSAQREQFGRPLAAFQSIQAMLADMAAETILARVAVQTAAAALDRGESGEWEIAVAKTVVGVAAATVCAAAHQVHGAMGFTDEHPLHRATIRLWAWRDEFGSETEWACRLADLTTRADAPELWTLLTATHPAALS